MGIMNRMGIKITIKIKIKNKNKIRRDAGWGGLRQAKVFRTPVDAHEVTELCAGGSEADAEVVGAGETGFELNVLPELEVGEGAVVVQGEIRDADDVAPEEIPDGETAGKGSAGLTASVDVDRQLEAVVEERPSIPQFHAGHAVFTVEPEEVVFERPAAIHPDAIESERGQGDLPAEIGGGIDGESRGERDAAIDEGQGQCSGLDRGAERRPVEVPVHRGWSRGVIPQTAQGDRSASGEVDAGADEGT